MKFQVGDIIIGTNSMPIRTYWLIVDIEGDYYMNVALEENVTRIARDDIIWTDRYFQLVTDMFRSLDDL